MTLLWFPLWVMIEGTKVYVRSVKDFKNREIS